MRFHEHAGIFQVLILYVQHFSFGVISAAENTFYCTKTKSSVYSTRRHKVKDVHRLQELEERLSELERLVEQRQMPNVIQIQSSTIPRDCLEIFRSRVKTDGVFTISPDGRCPFDVFCDIQDGGWTVLQRRKSGNIRFDRKWMDYTEGFGDLHTDFWLGLDKMHRLTQLGSRLLVVMEHYNESRKHEWAQYESFVIGDVVSGYKMNVDPFGYEGTIKESLSYHNGRQFSTIDRDNDGQQESCRRMYGGAGWWFLSCYRLGLLNGIHGKAEKGGISYWEDGDNFVKNTEMKIKPMTRSC